MKLPSASATLCASAVLSLLSVLADESVVVLLDELLSLVLVSVMPMEASALAIASMKPPPPSGGGGGGMSPPPLIPLLDELLSLLK
jgi:hypothetical protein